MSTFLIESSALQELDPLGCLVSSLEPPSVAEPATIDGAQAWHYRHILATLLQHLGRQRALVKDIVGSRFTLEPTLYDPAPWL